MRNRRDQCVGPDKLAVHQIIQHYFVYIYIYIGGRRGGRRDIYFYRVKRSTQPYFSKNTNRAHEWITFQQMRPAHVLLFEISETIHITIIPPYSHRYYVMITHTKTIFSLRLIFYFNIVKESLYRHDVGTIQKFERKALRFPRRWEVNIFPNATMEGKLWYVQLSHWAEWWIRING